MGRACSQMLGDWHEYYCCDVLCTFVSCTCGNLLNDTTSLREDNFHLLFDIYLYVYRSWKYVLVS